LELEEPTADEFGSADDGEGNEVKVPAKAVKTSTKASKKPPVDDETDSSDSPF
jgi:hypothetical protein